MTEEEHQRTDSRETEDGPGESKLAPAGNSKARIFIPSDPTEGGEEPSQDQGGEEPSQAQAREPDEQQESGKPQEQESKEQPTAEPSSEREPAEASGATSDRSLPVARLAAVAGAALAAGLAVAARARARARRPKNPVARLLRR